MNDAVPGPLIEAVDGALAPMLLAMMLSALFYLHRLWRENSYSFVGIRLEAKAAWATVLLFFGIGMKNDMLWVWRHMTNHHEQSATFSYWAQVMLVVSTAITLWGAVCWVRSVMPVGCGARAWVWVALFSVAFGVWFAL
jgi:hypothetical protein